MTRDVRVGRVLIAALQQAIAEEAPARAEFYDHWLEPERRRDGTLGLAPMTAVVGFLRTEGEAYGRIVAAAGRYVGQWTWRERSGWRRQVMRAMPRPVRIRSVARTFATIVAETCPATGVRTQVRGSAVSIAVTQSVFCGSRERPAAPLCGCYAAVFVSLCEEAGLVATGTMTSCRAGGVLGEKGGTCTGEFDVSMAS